MAETIKLKEYFGVNLAVLLAGKIAQADASFDGKSFVRRVNGAVRDLELKARVNLIAQELKNHLMSKQRGYRRAIDVLMRVSGPENPKETGMFKTGYWLMPVAKFVEAYGLEHYDLSMQAIYEITKRHTGEYAIRPYIEQKPRPSVRLMKRWARDANVHARRLASEGLRPRLPWAKKLDVFIDDPEPILGVLDLLKADRSSFVKKSVANNMNDILKDNYSVAITVLQRWAARGDSNTNWIIKHALRNQLKHDDRKAIEIVARLR